MSLDEQIVHPLSPLTSHSPSLMSNLAALSDDDRIIQDHATLQTYAKPHPDQHGLNLPRHGRTVRALSERRRLTSPNPTSSRTRTHTSTPSPLHTVAWSIQLHTPSCYFY